jgi:sn-glycerol 3-phosphate transport system ATP-binding protein
LGAQRLVHGSVDGKKLTAALSPDIELADTIALTIAPSRLHFFDTTTGKRLAQTLNGLRGRREVASALEEAIG